MIRVALVEDDPVTLKGLLMHLRRAPNLVCVGAHENATDALRKLPEEKPDVVLMDINLPGMSGIECVATLKLAHPDIQILMLTTYEDGDLIFESLRAGASGYLLKRTASTQLIAAIEEVQMGGAPMSMQIARKVVEHFYRIKMPGSETDQLSARELQILALLAEGAYYKEIAEKLGISQHTVRNHLHGIYGKLHVQTRTEAVLKYLKRPQ